MFKITIKYLIALLLSMMLIVSNTSAHHKSKKEKNVKTEWNGDSKTKKVFEKQSLAQYCAHLKHKQLLYRVSQYWIKITKMMMEILFKQKMRMEFLSLKMIHIK